MITVPNEPIHPTHDVPDPTCPGAPAGFEADCGQPGPHGPHPIGDVRTTDAVPRTCLYPATPICVIDSENFCRTHQGVHPAGDDGGFAEGFLAGLAAARSGEREQQLRCPDWCVRDHAEDDPRTDLILHQAPEHGYGIRLSRTDCPSEGRIGKPVLHVDVDLELTGWEDAGRLAHAILEGVDFLIGADQ